MKLTTPQEPKEVKEWITTLGQKVNDGEINWDSLNVWYGNKLPKYLWGKWKVELSSSGFNWQKFLKLMSFRTDQIVLWVDGEIAWENLVEQIRMLIYGPLGQRTTRNKKF